MKWDIGNRVEEWSLDIPSWVENFPMQRDTSESAPEDTVIWDRDQGLRECPGDPGVSTPFPLQGLQVPFLVGGLRARTLRGTAKEKRRLKVLEWTKALF